MDDFPALSTIRRNRGVSLEEIANSTKISVRSLEAIERGDFRKLPGGIYSTSYIKQYARAIDYDAAIILDIYYRATDSPSPDSDGTAGRNGNSVFRDYRQARTAVRPIS